MKLKFLSAEFTLEELAEGAPFLKKLFVDVLHYHRTPEEADVNVVEKFIFVTFDKRHSWVFYMDEVKDEAELTCVCENYKEPFGSTLIYQQTEDRWLCWTPESGYKVLGMCYNEKQHVYVECWPEGKKGVVTVSWFKDGVLKQGDYRGCRSGNLVGYYGFILQRKDEDYGSSVVDFLYFDGKGPHLLVKRNFYDLKKRFDY